MIRHRLSISLYFLCKSLTKLIVDIVSLTILFTGICILLFMNDSVRSIQSIIESVISKPITQCGVIYADYSSSDRTKVSSFLQELNSENYIFAFGNIMSGTFGDSIPDLRTLQNNYLNEIKKEDDFFQGELVYYSNMKCMSLMGVELSSGEFADQSAINNLYSQNSIGVYLGYGYNNIPVGTEFDINNGNKCVVLGILKKGTRWLGQNVFHPNQIYNLNILVNMDYAILVAEPVLAASPMIVAFNDDISFESGSQKIEELSSKYNIHLFCKSFEQLINESEMVEKNDRQLLLLLDVFMILILIMIISKFSIGMILKRKGEYGVFISSGATLSDIKVSFIIEYLLKWLTSGILAFTLSYFYAFFRYGSFDSRYYRVINYIVFNHTLLKYILISMAIGFLSIIVPYYRIKHLKLTDYFR